jgi:hypothetical protein
MSTYYKYAEQSADSQVNWADVSKSVSDMLKAEVEIRDKKKAAYQEAFDADMKNLSNAPQGKFQDGNKFTNDFAHDMMQQQLIDNRLLKSGNMSPQDYTLRRQNYVNGTNTIFDLQKEYQAVSPERMEGLLSGKYQALTGANMAQIEGFKDFSTSKAIINPYSADISIGKMKPNPDTGVMELTKDVVPVNVLKGMILSPIPTWDADKAVNSIVDNLGDRVEFLYDAASVTKAGTITKLIGLEALQGEFNKKDKDGKPLFPQFGDSIANINKGLEDSIDSFFSNPYNITSVLTQNIGGKYNQDSYVYDKDLAEKDKDKILLKIDPMSGLGTLDKDSPNYDAQVKEARAWVKGQMLSKMDAKREISTTGYVSRAPQASESTIQRGIDASNAIKDAQTIGSLWGGNEAQIQKAVTRFRDMNPNIKEVNRTDKGVFVTLDVNGVRETRDLPFYTTDGKRVLSQAEFIESASNLLTGNTNLTDAISRGGYLKGAVFNPSTKASARVQTQDATKPSGLPPAPQTRKYLGGSTPAKGGVGAKYNTQKP